MEERIEDLLPLYALGALSDGERVRVEAYTAAHPEARAHLDELLKASSALPYVVSPIEPPAQVKRALLARRRPGTGALEARRRCGSLAEPPSPVNAFGRELYKQIQSVMKMVF